MKKYLYRVSSPFMMVYWFIFRPHTIGVRCLVESDDKKDVLLVRHTYMYSDYWSAPGGGIKKGESMFDVAKREVKEEVGLDIYNIRCVGKYLTREEYKFNKVDLTIAQTKLKDFKIDKREILEARWFPKNKLPENIFIATKNILEKTTC